MGTRLVQDLTADGVPQQIIDEDVNPYLRTITQASVLIVLCLTMEDMDCYPDEKRPRSERIMAQQSAGNGWADLLLAAHVLGFRCMLDVCSFVLSGCGTNHAGVTNALGGASTDHARVSGSIP
jgi:hypothetical protein